LFYEKSGTPADFPFFGNASTRRGTVLESVAVNEYELSTGAKTEPAKFMRHRAYPGIGVHIDRIVIDDAKHGPGVLEVKVPGREMFLNVRHNGPPVAWKLQVQHGMWVAELAWGRVLAFNADLWQMLWWDYEYDPAASEMILAKGVAFWRAIEAYRGGDYSAIPSKLDPSDSRCKTCPWRKTCQGLANENDLEPELSGEEVVFDPDLRQLSLDLIEAKQAARAAIQHEQELSELLKSRMGGRRAVQTGASMVTLRAISRKAYTVPQSTMWQLRVHPNHEQ
jgi:hypothetical protein